MYDELINSLRICGKMRSIDDNCVAFHDGCCEAEPLCMYELMWQAADAIEELQKAVLRLEEESGLLDELPMVDQSTPCDTCAHKGNVDFDYCHICNNEADMYKPQPPKEV